jgi:hypothetical protein
LEAVEMIIDNTISAPVECQQSHEDFLPLRARVERQAHFAFRHPSAADREEAASEAVAAALQSFVRLRARGKNPECDFPIRKAHWAALALMEAQLQPHLSRN